MSQNSVITYLSNILLMDRHVPELSDHLEDPSEVFLMEADIPRHGGHPVLLYKKNVVKMYLKFLIHHCMERLVIIKSVFQGGMDFPFFQYYIYK